MSAPRLRPATPADLDACARVAVEALEDLRRRAGREGPPLSAEAEAGLLRHGFQLAPHGFHVAQDEEGRVVAFAAAWPRDGLWWLGHLFARPDAQGRGLGRALLARALAPGEGAANVFTFASADLRAQALYLRHGLLPRQAVLSFSLRPAEADAEPPLALAPLRRSTLAFERARFGRALGHEHRFLHERGAGFELARPDGARAGIGYLGDDGRVGPLAVEEEADLPGALDALAAEAARRGIARATLRVPHASEAAARWCVARGARFEGANLLMASAPLGPMDLVVLGPPGLA